MRVKHLLKHIVGSQNIIIMKGPAELWKGKVAKIKSKKDCFYYNHKVYHVYGDKDCIRITIHPKPYYKDWV